MCSGSEAGSFWRLIDFCIAQLKAQGPSRTCNESKAEKGVGEKEKEERVGEKEEEKKKMEKNKKEKEEVSHLLKGGENEEGVG